VLVVPCVRTEDYRERYAEPDKAGSPPPEQWPVPFWWVDAGAALMLVLLAATDEGLAAGFLAADETALRRLLALPEDVRTLGVVTVGHPAPDRPSSSLHRGRRPAADTVHWQTWPGGGEGETA
jgi:FMN reductase [NAD(P)H]